MLSTLFAFCCRIPFLKRILWKRWYDYLAGRMVNPDWTFMNYGYLDVSQTTPLKLKPEDEQDRFCIQLYHQVIGETDLKGKEVVEVGSGRGGGASYVHRYLGPRSTLGLDVSQNAVNTCRKVHPVPGLTFQKGDAEHLPLEDESVDVVLNVESSHCYGDLKKFFSEVRRVLRPGGWFLYADLWDGSKIEEWKGQLEESGLKIIRSQEITYQVLAALDADHERKLKKIRETVPAHLVKPFLDFAGIKGTRVYDLFRNGDLKYASHALQKCRAESR